MFILIQIHFNPSPIAVALPHLSFPMLPQHPHRFVDLPTPSSSEQLIPSQQSSSSLDKKNHDPPVSPTALYQHMITSGTLDNKSPEELRTLVQEAYTTLRAKEKGMLHTCHTLM